MLNTYLKKIGLVTGPIEKNTSYSGLESLRKYLLGEPQFLGGEEFFLFGNALHERLLEDKYDAYNKLPSWKQEMVEEMLIVLRAHPVVTKLMLNSVKEEKQYSKMNGVVMAYVLDIKKDKEKIGADLKTTACTTYHDCLKKAIEYGYVKQGKIYMEMEDLKEFYFIFITKSKPYNVFIISYKDFKDEEQYAENELEFLLYFYKNYGRFMTDEDKQNLNTDMKKSTESKTRMALTSLKEAAKSHKSNKAECARATKQAAKSRAYIISLVEKFPKADTPLYKEKLDSYISNL